jgi:hypothetical protein
LFLVSWLPYKICFPLRPLRLNNQAACCSVPLCLRGENQYESEFCTLRRKIDFSAETLRVLHRTAADCPRKTEPIANPPAQNWTNLLFGQLVFSVIYRSKSLTGLGLRGRCNLKQNSTLTVRSRFGSSARSSSPARRWLRRGLPARTLSASAVSA